MTWLGASNRAYAAAPPLGSNFSNQGYFNPEQAFLNIFKMSGQAAGNPLVSGHQNGEQGSGWLTAGAGGGGDTLEEGYLQLDADGYVTLLPVPGRSFTTVKCNIMLGLNLVPGTATRYPGGPYTIQGIGAGTFSFNNDASTGAVVSGAVTQPGGAGTTTFQATGTLPWSVSVVMTPTNLGTTMVISATDPLATGNYLRNFSMVQSSLLAMFNGGEIFHPNFLAACAHFTSFRFMKWLAVEGEVQGLSLAGSPSGVSTTLGGTWLGPTKVLDVLFSDGEFKACQFTIGSSTITWSGALTGVGLVAVAYYCPYGNSTWANRSLPSNMFYTTLGVPWEICFALCNKLNAHCYGNRPAMGFGTPNTFQPAKYVTPLNTLAKALLNPNLNFIIEPSNEVWNGRYGIANSSKYAAQSMTGWLAQSSGPNDFQLNRNWYGMICALMAQQDAIDWGASFNRCYPVLAGQYGNIGTFTQSMDTAFWFTNQGQRASNASLYPIKQWAGAPYWGGFDAIGSSVYPNQASANVILAQADPIAAFLSLATTNVVAGTTMVGSSGVVLPANGFMGQVQASLVGTLTTMASYINGTAGGSTANPNLKLMAYEGGPNFLFGPDANYLPPTLPSGTGFPTGYGALAQAANRDPRMGALIVQFLQWWGANVGTSPQNCFHFFTLIVDSTIGNRSGGAGWGAAETSMQAFSPKSSAPAKWAALQTYMGF